jgi:hypothetical protein
MNPNPTCHNEDCRFHYGMSMTTCAYYPPVYDKHGNNINPDRNVTSGTVNCSTCNKEWKYSSQLDETTYVEIKNGNE